jgi:hypothetical protein
MTVKTRSARNRKVQTPKAVHEPPLQQNLVLRPFFYAGYRRGGSRTARSVPRGSAARSGFSGSDSPPRMGKSTAYFWWDRFFNPLSHIQGLSIFSLSSAIRPQHEVITLSRIGPGWERVSTGMITLTLRPCIRTGRYKRWGPFFSALDMDVLNVL